MPETVAAWIAANTLTATSVLTYSQVVALTYVAFAAATAGIGDHQRRKARSKARDALNASLEDRLVMTATAQAARSRVYGRARNVDGILFKQTHGTNSEFYTMVIALAGHEVDAIETIYFNELAVALDGSGYVQTAPYLQNRVTTAGAVLTVAGGAASVVLPYTPISGSVSGVIRLGGDNGDQVLPPTSVVGNTVTFAGFSQDGPGAVIYQHVENVPMARVRAYTGAAGQDLYSVLQPLVGAAVTPTDNFKGMACLVVTLQYSQDAFPSGVPQMSAVMRGAKVYDPRSGLTVWTENPALVARDWSLYAYGGGCVSDELNEPAFVAAANACDTSTSFTTAAGVDTRPLYQCGAVFRLDGNPDDALNEICESMAGQWGWAGGRLSVRAGVYRAPVLTVTEDWVTSAEDINLVVSSATSEAINVMRPTLADAANAYAVTPAPEVRAAAYVTADGRELAQELQLGAVTRAVHAQHICGVLMREARESLTLTLPCNLRALQLELFDVVTVVLPRFGWGAGKLFEVTGWRFTMTGGVLLTLRETAAAIYTPDSLFDVLNTSPNTGLPQPQQVPALTGLAATSESLAQADGSTLARTTLTWTASASEAVRQSGSVEIQFVDVASGLPAGDWPAAPPASGRATRSDVFGLRLGVAYGLRARFVNTLGMAGPWALTTHKVTGVRAARTWRQTAAPSTGVQDGDEWIDSDDGNKRYQREAGVWVAVALGTGGLAADAATEVLFDEYDFAGAGQSTGLQVNRTFTMTPGASGTCEFSSVFNATNVVVDSGNSMYWRVTPAGGAAINIGGPAISTTANQVLTALQAFAVTGGVELTFDLMTNRPFGNPVMAMGKFYTRITIIKR